MRDVGEQITVGRIDVGTDQNGLATLKDFVVRADANGLQIDARIDRPCGSDGLLKDVADGGVRDRIIDEIAAEFRDAAKRTVIDEQEAEYRLFDPLARDGQREQNLVVIGLRRRKLAVERRLHLVRLRGNEFSADVMIACGLTDRLVPGNDLHGQIATLGRIERPRRKVPRRSRGRVDKLNHVCFFHECSFCNSHSGRNRHFAIAESQSQTNAKLLPTFEPCRKMRAPAKARSVNARIRIALLR